MLTSSSRRCCQLPSRQYAMPVVSGSASSVRWCYLYSSYCVVLSIAYAMSRWREERTLKFVRLYREFECLWHVGSPFYKKKSVRLDAYKKLIEKMGDRDLTVDSVKTKIKNLRSTYHHELKKMEGAKTPEGDAIYKPNLIWFEDMHSILGDMVQHRESPWTGVSTYALISGIV